MTSQTEQPKDHFVYALYVDDFDYGGYHYDDECPFYVGCVGVKRGQKRILGHISTAKRGVGASKQKIEFIRAALGQEKTVISKQIVKHLTKDDAISLEEHLIKEIGRVDLGTGPLMNKTDGGSLRGGKNQSPQNLAKLVERSRSPEHKEMLARLHSSPEHKEMLARLHSSPEHSARGRSIENLARLEKYRNSPEYKAQLARLHSDPNHAAKISVGMRRAKRRQTIYLLIGNINHINETIDQTPPYLHKFQQAFADKCAARLKELLNEQPPQPNGGNYVRDVPNKTQGPLRLGGAEIQPENPNSLQPQGET